MKNVFVELMEVEVDGTGTVKTTSCWVNMSRVQEMRLGTLQGIGVPREVPITFLKMNIPDYEITVQEHPSSILSQLNAINKEPPK